MNDWWRFFEWIVNVLSEWLVKVFEWFVNVLSGWLVKVFWMYEEFFHQLFFLLVSQQTWQTKIKHATLSMQLELLWNLDKGWRPKFGPPAPGTENIHSCAYTHNLLLCHCELRQSWAHVRLLTNYCFTYYWLTGIIWCHLYTKLIKLFKMHIF